MKEGCVMTFFKDCKAKIQDRQKRIQNRDDIQGSDKNIQQMGIRFMAIDKDKANL